MGPISGLLIGFGAGTIIGVTGALTAMALLGEPRTTTASPSSVALPAVNAAATTPVSAPPPDVPPLIAAMMQPRPAKPERWEVTEHKDAVTDRRAVLLVGATENERAAVFFRCFQVGSLTELLPFDTMLHFAEGDYRADKGTKTVVTLRYGDETPVTIDGEIVDANKIILTAKTREILTPLRPTSRFVARSFKKDGEARDILISTSGLESQVKRFFELCPAWNLWGLGEATQTQKPNP